MKNKFLLRSPRFAAIVFGLLSGASAVNATDLDLSDEPLFLVDRGAAPLTMLTVGRNHKLYNEAYNDASDLDGDGDLDVGYNPGEIDYFGYFDSFKCYTYSAGDGRFNPVSFTANKTCSGLWSGDFLNYLTTSRIDALRKVLYGGRRFVDGTNQTILDRSYIPQDAHSWGKEYQSVGRDGYDIRDYSPLSLPADGRYHLFASTTRISPNGLPHLRVFENSRFRIWNWVAIERPIADSGCFDNANRRVNCVNNSAGGGFDLVPPASSSTPGLANLTFSVYDRTSLGGNHPDNHPEYESQLAAVANPAFLCGTGTAQTITSGGLAGGRDNNPFPNSGPCADNNENGHGQYMVVYEGQYVVPPGQGGDITFSVDGDDAIEFAIDLNNNGIFEGPANGSGLEVITSFYGGHGTNPGGLNNRAGTVNLSPGVYNIRFLFEEVGGGDSWVLVQSVPPVNAQITDLVTRVAVCVPNLLEDNCTAYGDPANPNFKPTGILQDFGENDSMLFGLLTGSFDKNISGGVLRKNVGTFTDEIDLTTGQFLNVDGIISNLDALAINGFGYPSTRNFIYTRRVDTRPMNQGELPDWGNPIGEMMYEVLRYFAGEAAPTAAFDVRGGGTVDSAVGLTAATWEDPYDPVTGNAQCALPFQVVISDINPNYDTDALPGSAFGGGTLTSPFTDNFNAAALADEISTQEGNIAGSRFIGQVGNVTDGAPTAKNVTGLGNIRGLAPEEPTKLGGYYSASAAYFGKTRQLRDDIEIPEVDTFSVALASPLPRIDIPVNGSVVTLVPFAKSVGGCLVQGPGINQFQPTNQIVDFFVEDLTPTQGAFRINYEDTEQGADHDMDAIVRYFYEVTPEGNVRIALSSEFAAGCIIQHMGYVISGTTNDGIYLEVRDVDTNANNDVDYFLDTPPGELPNGNFNDNTALPLTAVREFTPGGGGTNTAQLLEDPLWYAAKYGGFVDEDGDNRPNLQQEWDEDGDGDPDNYFLVTNALTLREQLTTAFIEILARAGSASAITLDSGIIRPDGGVAFATGFDSADWSGSVNAFNVSGEGGITDNLIFSSSDILDARDPDSRNIVTSIRASLPGDVARGVEFLWDDLSPDQQDDIDTDDTIGELKLDYVRGDRNELQFGGVFRDRSTVLGAVINSEALRIAVPTDPFEDEFDFGLGSPEQTAQAGGNGYRQFILDQLNRTPVLYVGANDGMMHGFDAETGTETFAFIPDEVIPSLTNLTDVNYRLNSFVDQTPTARSVYFTETGSGWKTVIVGGLRHGGQGFYALDVTNPDVVNPGAAADKVLWEFTDADDAGLGYSYGQPFLTRITASGGSRSNWVALVGNGYNNTEADDNVSTTGRGALYVINLETGALIRKLELPAVADPLGENRANALGSPTGVDLEEDEITDLVYAGDLFGNLWEFDIRDPDPSNWRIANGGGPLFTASSDGLTPDTGNYQPITLARPRVFRDLFADDGAGSSQVLVITFGTGKFLEESDNGTLGENAITQSLYGIRDLDTDCFTTACRVDRNQLQERRFFVASSGTALVRGLEDPSQGGFAIPTGSPGWFINLTNLSADGTPNSTQIGERQIQTASVRGSLLVIPTVVPSDDGGSVCLATGQSFLNVINPITGGTTAIGAQAEIDFNGDGVINSGDTIPSSDTDQFSDQLASRLIEDVIVGVTSTVVRGEGDDTIIVSLAGTGGSGGGDDGSIDAEEVRARGIEVHRRSWMQQLFGN